MFLAKTIIFPPKISLKLSATTFCSNLVDRFTDKTQYKKTFTTPVKPVLMSEQWEQCPSVRTFLWWIRKDEVSALCSFQCFDNVGLMIGKIISDL